MVAAKTGAANKIGYIAAHSAIVLVCIGGLLDGDLMVRAQTWFNGKSRVHRRWPDRRCAGAAPPLVQQPDLPRPTCW